MNFRTAALASFTVASFVACGRLDLGDYADLDPNDSDPPPVVVPPAPSGEGGAAGARSAGNGSGATDSAAAGGGGVGDAGRSAVVAAGGEGGASAGGEGGVGAGGEGGAGGEAPVLPAEKRSCRSAPAICGAGPDQQSCCAVEYVSAGEFVRGGIKEGEPPAAPSHVSGFYLGVYEVTVGRFQAFLNDYDRWRASGAPRPGDGRHPLLPNSGWRPDWLREPGEPSDADGLAVDRAQIESEVSGCLTMPFSTAMWLQPVNCVSFYEAQAFCIWDGGRLPTDIEWEYAAAGGDENRRYPWGADEPTHDHAMYGCFSSIGSPCLIPPVGSFKRGQGRFGQLDLAGSLAEWTFDTAGPEFPVPCHDCANVDQIHDVNPRNTRGGDWTTDASKLAATSSHFMEAYLHLAMHGIRCAYDAP